jgi:hypothetical protein
VLPAALLDLVTVVVFVIVGRRSHDEAGGIGQVFEVAAPFLLALALAWVLTRAWRSAYSTTTGMQIWLITAALGPLLRRFAFDRSTAGAFVVVATLFLGLFLVGWRVVWRETAPRLARRAAD